LATTSTLFIEEMSLKEGGTKSDEKIVNPFLILKGGI
jgi:hypothetical protein